MININLTNAILGINAPNFLLLIALALITLLTAYTIPALQRYFTASPAANEAIRFAIEETKLAINETKLAIEETKLTTADEQPPYKPSQQLAPIPTAMSPEFTQGPSGNTTYNTSAKRCLFTPTNSPSDNNPTANC
jgi:hypothetical protein